jgi:capsular exopolysaccharide synthesis family protein
MGYAFGRDWINMSNFFESLQKAELIAPGELALPLDSHVAATTAVADEDFPVQAPAPGGASAVFRTARLRLSAEAPVFPFEADSAAADQYRIIRTKILHHHAKPRVIVVSSGGPGDGKTVTAINIASSFALKQDVRVALVDADMRRPQIANTLGLSGTPGLSDVLTGQVSFEEAVICPEEAPYLAILPAGTQRAMHAELLDSERWRTLVTKLRHTFDYVIFDAPPIASLADYELLQLAADGVVVVARPDHSERKSCLDAIQAVPKEKLIGVILNCIQDWLFWRKKGYGYYSQRQQSQSTPLRA